MHPKSQAHLQDPHTNGTGKLTQFDNEISMFRWKPPNGSAGFHS